MNERIKKIKSIGLKEAFPWILLGLTYIGYLLFMWKYLDTHIDSDMSAEIIYADLLNKQGKFISSDFFFSTRIRILGCHQFYRIGLMLAPHNWRIARFIGTIVQLLIITILYIVMCRKIGEKYKKLSVYFAALCMCPFGTWYMFHVLFSNAYTMFLIVLYVWIILIWFLIDNNEVNGKFIVLGALFVTLNLYNGMDSVTYALYTIGPILCVLIFEYIYCKLSDTDLTATKRLLGVTAAAITSYGIGYFINSHYLSKIYTYESYSNRILKLFDINEIVLNISEFFTMFGFPYDAVIRDMTGYESAFSKYILLAFGGLLVALIVLISIVYNFCIIKKLSFKERFVLELFVSSILVIAVSRSLIYLTDYSYYNIVLVPLAYMSFQITCAHIEWKLFSRKQLLVFGTALSAVLSVLTCMRFVDKPIRARIELRNVTNFLQMVGAKEIYATFWDGPVITEMSSGDIETYVVEEYDNMLIYKWLQKKDHIKKPTKGQIYVVLNKDGVPDRDVNNLFWYDADECEFVYGDGNTDYWIIRTDCMNLIAEDSNAED